MITQAESSIGPKAIPRLRSARRHSKLRVLSEDAPTSMEACLPRSPSGVLLTKLSTFRSPLALLNMLDDSAVGVAGGAVAAALVVKMFEGTAALPSVVKKASRGVARRKRPATCVNFWNDLIRPW